MRKLALLPVMLAAAALSACGEQTVPVVSAGSTSCAAGVAQIGVFDGFSKILCGCNEVGGLSVISPATLSCTVPAGTLVVFQYLGTTLKHQIVPTGTVSVFAASPVSDPLHGPAAVRSHAVKLGTAGDYPFQDALNAAIAGTVHVI